MRRTTSVLHLASVPGGITFCELTGRRITRMIKVTRVVEGGNGQRRYIG